MAMIEEGGEIDDGWVPEKPALDRVKDGLTAEAAARVDASAQPGVRAVIEQLREANKDGAFDDALALLENAEGDARPDRTRHAFVFERADDKEAKFRCIYCRRPIGFALPGLGSPHAVSDGNGGFAVPDDADSYIIACNAEGEDGDDPSA